MFSSLNGEPLYGVLQYLAAIARRPDRILCRP